MNYYQYNRNQTGRYSRKSIDWDKLGEHMLFITVGIWISYNIFNIILKAHGL